MNIFHKNVIEIHDMLDISADQVEDVATVKS